MLFVPFNHASDGGQDHGQVDGPDAREICDPVPGQRAKADSFGAGLLNTKEICALLRISKRTLATLRKHKKIPFVKIGPRTLRYSLPTILSAKATGMKISR